VCLIEQPRGVVFSHLRAGADGLSNTDLAFEWLDNQVHSRGYEMARLGDAWFTDGPTRECIVEFMAYEPSLFRCAAPHRG